MAFSGGGRCLSSSAAYHRDATLLTAVAVVIDRHAEQHGHCASLALIDVEHPQRLQGDVKLSLCGRGSHASFFATASVSDAVRRRGIESDKVGQ